MPMPTRSPHSSLLDLRKTTQGNEGDRPKSASRNGSKLEIQATNTNSNGNNSNSPNTNTNTPSRPSQPLSRRRTTGDVTTQNKVDYYASLQQTTSPLNPGGFTLHCASMPLSTVTVSSEIFDGMDNAKIPSPVSSQGKIAGTGDTGDTSINTSTSTSTSTAFNHPSWNADANSPIRRSSLPQNNAFAHRDRQQTSHPSHYYRRLSSDASKMPESNKIYTSSQIGIEPKSFNYTNTIQSPSNSYVNPFEDPAIIGDLTQSIPMTQVRSFPSSTSYHPLQHQTPVVQMSKRSGEQLLDRLLLHHAPDPSHVRASTTGHMPQVITDPTVSTSTSPSHKHSIFDPLLNTQPRPSLTTDIVLNSVENPTNFQSVTLDTASLADIAARLSTLKPQKQDSGLEEKKNHLLTLGTTPVESTGTKKSHKRFLSQPFSRKNGAEMESGEDKSGHRRSISAGLAAVFKRAEDGGEKDGTRSLTPIGGGRNRGKKGSPMKGIDGIQSSESPTTPGRRKGLNLRRTSRPDKNTEAMEFCLEVIQSGSGEDISPNIEIKLRSSEQDPSPHQVSIPAVNDLLYSAKLCELLEEYRVIDQNFAFGSLVGMTRAQMHQFLQDKKPTGMVRNPTSPDSSQPTSPLSAGSPVSSSLDRILTSLTAQQQQLMETHVPIVSSLFDADDLVVEGFYHEVCDVSKNKAFDTTNEKSTRDRVEVAIFKNDAQRQFIVVYQGCAEAQMKPIKKGEQKDGIDRRFTLGRKDDDNRFSEEQPVVVFPPFRKAYFNSEVEVKVFTKLDDLVEQHPFFDVVMTGNSFGGVLALLSSMRYANMRPQIMTSCFAFGCPKIGTIDFRYYVNSLPNLRVIRVEYGCDPWINAPDHPNWCHAGHTIAICKYNENSNMDKSERSSELMIRAFKFGDNRPESGGKEGKKIGKILSRQTNKEKQMDHDIASYVHALKEITRYGNGPVGMWPKRFVGEEGTGVEGLDKEKRLVC